jgi:arylsulfatase A
MKRTAIFISLLSLTFCAGIQAQTQEHPNIIFILADDMSFDSVSANNNKIGNMKTPQIDKLISEGMNFTDAHSGSAVCTPTRYGILTGRYCWRTKLKRSVLWTYAAPLIKKERLTVAEMLREKGYRTAMVGKWHLGLDWRGKDGHIVNGDLKLSDNTFRKGEGPQKIKVVDENIDFSQPITGGPTDHGFDYFWGVDVPNFAPYVWIENDRIQGNPSAAKPDKMFGAPGAMLPGWKLEDILPTLGNKASAWITEQAKQVAEDKRPFFLYLPLTSPHTPIAPSENFRGKSGISHYADFVMETDAVVGQVLAALEKSGAAENTLVIFTTDNGTSAKANFKKLEKHGVDLRNHFKGHKAQIHEGGHRVPFVVRWPGKTKPGTTCDQTICLGDFMATAAEITSYQLPKNSAEDSTSILSLITGKQKTLPNRPLVINHDIQGNFAIRKGKWKLVGDAALYDLEADPKESNNLAAKYPERVKELSEALKRAQNSEHQ